MNKYEEYNEFKKNISIIKFIIENMEQIIKEGIIIVDVTEKPDKYPHYESRIICELHYNDGFIYTEHRSGSPSAWNSYNNDTHNIISLANAIKNDIQAAKIVDEEEDIECYYLKIEGV